MCRRYNAPTQGLDMRDLYIDLYLFSKVFFYIKGVSPFVFYSVHLFSADFLLDYFQVFTFRRKICDRLVNITFYFLSFCIQIDYYLHTCLVFMVLSSCIISFLICVIQIFLNLYLSDIGKYLHFHLMEDLLLLLLNPRLVLLHLIVLMFSLLKIYVFKIHLQRKIEKWLKAEIPYLPFFYFHILVYFTSYLKLRKFTNKHEKLRATRKKIVLVMCKRYNALTQVLDMGDLLIHI